MKLADYLHQNRMTPTEFRRRLGLSNRATMRRYLHGLRIPEPRTMQRIIDITKGAVQLVDFLDSELPECAVKIVRPNGSIRIVFPWSTSVEDLEASYQSSQDQAEEDALPSLAVQKALAVLGSRASVRSRDLYMVDRRVTDARGVIQAANRLLSTWGQPPIPYPGVQRPDTPSRTPGKR